MTISLLLCEHCRKEQEEESTAAAVAGIESGSLPRMPSSSALSISPPVTAETPAAGLNASNTYSTRASAREVSLTLATPQKANVVVAGTAAKADIDDDDSSECDVPQYPNFVNDPWCDEPFRYTAASSSKILRAKRDYSGSSDKLFANDPWASAAGLKNSHVGMALFNWDDYDGDEDVDPTLASGGN